MIHPLSAAVLLAVAAAGAGAQTPTPEQIREQQRRYNDAALTTPQRLEALDKSIDLRRQLIAASENDPNLGALLLEHAEALLARLGADGTDSAAMFGVIPPAARPVVAALAREAAETADRCAAWFDKRIAEGEAKAGGAQREKEFALFLQLRDRRLPVPRARAWAVHASLADRAETGAAAARARTIAESARGDDAEREAKRLISLGQACLLLRQPDAAGDAFRQALAAAPAATSPFTAAPRVEATLGRVASVLASRGPGEARALLREAVAGSPFVIEGRPQPNALLLAADMQHRIGMAEADASEPGPGRARAVGDALAVYSRLVDRADLGVDRPQRVALALSRLTATAPEDVEMYPSLPALAAYAKGTDLGMQRGGFKKAVTLLEGVTQPGSERLKELGPIGADALWNLAALRNAEAKELSDDSVLAVSAGILTRLAVEFPDSPRAPDAIATATMYVEGVRRTAPDDPDLLAQHLGTLRTAIARFPGHERVDAWRLTLAQNLIFPPRALNHPGQPPPPPPKPATAEAIEEGMRALADVAPASRLAFEAWLLTARGQALRMASADDAVRFDAARRLDDLADTVSGALADSTAEPGRKARQSAVTGAVLAYCAQAAAERKRFQRAVDLSNRAEALASADAETRREALGLALAARMVGQASLGDLADAVDTAARFPAADTPPPQAALRTVGNLIGARLLSAERAGDQREASRIAKDLLLPIVRAGIAAADFPSARSDWIPTYVEALVRSGAAAEAETEALAEIQKNGPTERLILWLGEARLALQKDDDAFVDLRDLFDVLEQRGQRDPIYWRAASRALEIAERRGAGADPAKASAMRSTIARMRLADPDLGGEPSRSRILAVEAALQAPQPK